MLNGTRGFLLLYFFVFPALLLSSNVYYRSKACTCVRPHSHFLALFKNQANSFSLPRQGLRDLTRSLVKIHHPSGTHPLCTPSCSPRVYRPPCSLPAILCSSSVWESFQNIMSSQCTHVHRGDLDNGPLRHMDTGISMLDCCVVDEEPD